MLDEATRQEGRALRIALIAKRGAPADLVAGFQNRHPEIEIEISQVLEPNEALAALESDLIDATFRALDVTADGMPGDIDCLRAYNEPHELLVGPEHPLASASCVTLEQLRGQALWIPGIGLAQDVEWATYYGLLADAFGLTIAATHPVARRDNLVGALAESSELATLEGTSTRFAAPISFDLRRIPLMPQPLYPHNLLWHADNTLPELELFREYVESSRVQCGNSRAQAASEAWLPDWARE